MISVHAVVTAIILAMHPGGFRHTKLMVPAHNGMAFDSIEKCERWRELTGWDTLDMWELEFERGPFVVVKATIQCVVGGKEI